MDVQIALSPDLPLTAAQFVERWNADPDCRAISTAERLDPAAVDFPIDPDLVRQGLIYMGGVASTLVLDSLVDVAKTQIKALVEEIIKEKPAKIRVEQVPQPDGSILLVVHGEADS
jgi:hypothetical protein